MEWETERTAFLADEEVVALLWGLGWNGAAWV